MSMKDAVGSLDALQATDPEVYAAIDAEEERQRNKLLLIASENFASPAVLAAQGSLMTNKYAEGYPGKRYYGGCQHVDTVEDLAIQRCKQIFGAEHVNVQPHSGSQANMAAYLSVLKPGDTILGMDLAQGGHLTHGSKVNFSGMIFRAFSYGVDRQTETIDYEAVQKLAEECRPRMIVVGASAYARTLDFPKFQAIAQSVGAYLMVDIAHIAGLIAAGLHPNPIPHADFVTTTTHKTLQARSAHAAGRRRDAVGDAVEALGEDARDGGLADAARAGEQEGVMHPTLRECIAQRHAHVLLPHQLGKGSGPPFARQREITHGFPVEAARTSRTSAPDIEATAAPFRA